MALLSSPLPSKVEAGEELTAAKPWLWASSGGHRESLTACVLLNPLCAGGISLPTCNKPQFRAHGISPRGLKTSSESDSTCGEVLAKSLPRGARPGQLGATQTPHAHGTVWQLLGDGSRGRDLRPPEEAQANLLLPRCSGRCAQQPHEAQT